MIYQNAYVGNHRGVTLLAVSHDKARREGEIGDIVGDWSAFFVGCCFVVPVFLALMWEGFWAWQGGYFFAYLTLCWYWILCPAAMDKVQQGIDTFHSPLHLPNLSLRR